MLERRHTSAARSNRKTPGGLENAGKGGGAGKQDAEEQNDGRDRTIKNAFKSGKLSEGHDRASFLFNPPGREAVRSGRCLDTTYLNVVKFIFTMFGFSFTVTIMRETVNAIADMLLPCGRAVGGPRTYHHGDLSRALILAGRHILETQGPGALSLRAVARQAGVSPAAPYHHFKDKSELLDAVASEGWHALGEAISSARARAATPQDAMTEIGVAYVMFARQNPALYRTMYDAAGDRAEMPDHAKDSDSGWRHVTEALIANGADPDDEHELLMATIAAWCSVHGVAEMAGFKEFEPIKEAMGGEEPFVRAILRHFGAYAQNHASRSETPPKS